MTLASRSEASHGRNPAPSEQTEPRRHGTKDLSPPSAGCRRSVGLASAFRALSRHGIRHGLCRAALRAGRERRHFRHRRSRGAASGAGLARRRRCRHRADHARRPRSMGLRVWLDLAIDQVAIDAPIRRREEQWFAPDDGGAPPSPWRTPRRLDVAYARLRSDRGRRRHGRMVAGPARAAGAGGYRRVPLPGPRPRAGVALAADHRRFAAGAVPLPGVDAGCRTRRVAATGRGRLRPHVFLARMVGWACEVVCRGGRDVAAHRAGDGIARAIVLRPARGASGSGQ